MHCFNQAVGIRLPDYPGQSLFGLGNHVLQKKCPTGQVLIGNKVTDLSHKLQASKIMA